MNVAQLLIDRAIELSDHAAIIDSSRWWTRTTTFQQLDQSSARLAGMLFRMGIGPGDGVLVLQPISVELYAVMTALFRLGAVAMFLDPSLGRAHVERCCQLWPPRGLVASPKANLLRLVCPSLNRIPVKVSIGRPAFGAVPYAEHLRGDALTDVVQVEPASPALLTFTSGVTGQPRAAVRSHGILLAQHLALSRIFEFGPQDVCMTTLPIVVLSQLAAGASVVLPDMNLRTPSRISCNRILRQLTRTRANSLVGPPSFIDRVTRDPVASMRPLGELKKIFTGGGPVYSELVDQVGRAAPNARFTAIYGSTEAEPIAHYTRPDRTAEIGSEASQHDGLLLGQPVAEIRLRIIEDRYASAFGELSVEEFQRLEQPCGQPGEIVVCGPHVIRGYHHGLGDQETKINVEGDVWHRTGDAGYLDHEGKLWLLGRCSAAARDQRGTLYPLAIETVARKLCGNRAVALLSRAGQRWLVVESPRRESFEHLLDHPKFVHAGIDRIYTIAKIPLDHRHNSKVDYLALRMHPELLDPE